MSPNLPRLRTMTRRFILAATLLLMITTLSVAIQLITAPIEAQGKEERNWIGSLHRPAGFARYLIIPDAAKALEQAQLNATLKKITQGRSGRDLLASPPPLAFAEVWRWLEVVPDSVKPALLRSIFPAGIGYVSSEEGSIFVAPVSAAGRALLEKKKPRFSAFKGGDFIYASKDSLLRAQLAHQATNAVAELTPNPGEIGIVFAPQDDPGKEETNLVFGAYRALFPASLVGPQAFVLSFDKNGVMVRSKAAYRSKQADIRKSISSLAPLKYLARSMTYDGLLLELAADSEAIGGFLQARPRERVRQPIAIYLNRFVPDFRRILPETALVADSKDVVITEFFSQAFRKGDYTEQVNQGTVRLLYGAHQYQDPKVVSFSPHYRTDKGVFLWASGSEGFAAVSALHNLPNRVTSDYSTALQQHGFQAPERVLAGASGNLKNLLGSLEQALSYSEAFYDRGSFGDFRDTLRDILKDVGKGNVTGFMFVHPDYVRSSIVLNL